MNTQVATAVKGVTWIELITNIEAGSQERFPYSKRAYISSLISRDIKFKHAEREFKTRKDGETLIVERIK